MCILIKFSAVAFSLSLSHSLSFSLFLSVLPFLVGLLPVSQATLGLKGAHRISSIRTATAAHTRSPYRSPPLAVINHLSCLKTRPMCNCAKCFSNVQNVGQKMKRNFSCSSSKDKQGKTREGGGHKPAIKRAK